MGGIGGRRLRPAEVRRAHRRVRGLQQQLLLPAKPAQPSGCDRHRRLAHDDDGQREGLPDDPGCLQAGSEGPGAQYPDGLLDLPGCSVFGRTEPAQLPVRHGLGGRGLGHAATAAWLSVAGRRDHIARWALPRVRSRRPGDRVQQWRRYRRAAQASRCAGRWRYHLRRHQGRGAQQRRQQQGEFHGAERRRACPAHLDGTGAWRHRPGNDLVHRSARYRHVVGRPDRDCRAHRRLSGRAVRARMGFARSDQ